MNHSTRRQFLQLSAAGAGTLLIPKWSWGLSPKAASIPQYFIQIYLEGGADPTYMFDARPLAMTSAGVIQNYLGTDPTPYVGSNGTSCLTTSLTAPLMPYRNRFSVVNGLMMSTSFDGHLQNINTAFTGNAFGGECFLPHLNLPATGQTPAAIDTMQNGSLFATFTNTGSTVPMDAAAMGPLISKLQALPPMDGTSELGGFIRGRMSANATGSSSFALGSQAMLSSFDQVSGLRSKLLQITPPDPTQDAETQYVSFLSSIFKSSVARSAIWVFTGAYDTHAYTDCSAQPTLFDDTVQRIARIFSALSNTPYDSTHSMFDVTTVMICTEFSRTMLQQGVTFAQTGTDHNPYNNSAIIAGNGIKGGQVIGASDTATLGETLSGAHLALDSDQIKLMGRPFNFTTMLPRTDLPATYSVYDYLNFGSLVNTIYTLFNVPAAKYRMLDRAGTVAPQLTGLLA